MKILGMLLLMSISNAFAATNVYELKIDLSVNGKLTSSPSISIKEGETGTITQKISDTHQRFIDVVATKSEIENDILMKFIVGTIDQNGLRHIESAPEVITQPNHLTSIVSQNRSEKLSLSVMATTKNH